MPEDYRAPNFVKWVLQDDSRCLPKLQQLLHHLVMISTVYNPKAVFLVFISLDITMMIHIHHWALHFHLVLFLVYIMRSTALVVHIPSSDNFFFHYFLPFEISSLLCYLKMFETLNKPFGAINSYSLLIWCLLLVSWRTGVDTIVGGKNASFFCAYSMSFLTDALFFLFRFCLRWYCIFGLYIIYSSKTIYTFTMTFWALDQCCLDWQT